MMWKRIWAQDIILECATNIIKTYVYRALIDK